MVEYKEERLKNVGQDKESASALEANGRIWLAASYGVGDKRGSRDFGSRILLNRDEGIKVWKWKIREEEPEVIELGNY